MNVNSNNSSKQSEHFSLGRISSNDTSCLVNSSSSPSAWTNSQHLGLYQFDCKVVIMTDMNQQLTEVHNNYLLDYNNFLKSR